MASLNRCVNCFIAFNSSMVCKGVLDLETSLLKLIMSWISLSEITSEHRICQQCFVIVQAQVQAVIPTRGFGHRSVCLGCGVSVLRARSIGLNRSRPQYNIIKAWVPQIQADLPIFTKVCRSCWRRATRAQQVNVAHIEQKLVHNVADAIMEVKSPFCEVHYKINVGVQANKAVICNHRQ